MIRLIFIIVYLILNIVCWIFATYEIIKNTKNPHVILCSFAIGSCAMFTGLLITILFDEF